MNWTWTTTWTSAGAALDHIWRSPALPMWIALGAGLFFALVLLVTLFRTERSVANGALIVGALIAVGIAIAVPARSFDSATAVTRPPPSASLPALACLDGLAGDAVETACERALFASAESSAAAVSYTAAQMTWLASFGENAIKSTVKSTVMGKAMAPELMAPELSALRRAVERDRYGLVAHVLTVREGCTPADCVFYTYLSDHNHIAANMTDRAYQGLIARYSTTWGIAIPNPGNPVVGSLPLPPSVPSGRPVSGDFPSSNSIPAISIMTPESSTPIAPPVAAPKTVLPPSTTAQTATLRSNPAPTAVKKQAPKKNTVMPVPLPLAPPSPSEDN